ncbi:MAG: flagellar basal body-associated FliL family protein [Candidatus Adiutrix sp.]|jgi:flagellar FliL protein|nr:flagellar basal body-associated FliL family protein [Candidatus Adiutrix sp.]
MAKKEKSRPAPEETAESGGEEAVTEKKGSKLKLIIIVALAMAVGGGGAFAAMKFLGGGAEVASEAAAGGASAGAAAHGEEEEPPIEAPKSKTSGSSHSGGEAGSTEGGGGEEALGPQNIEFKPFVVNLNDGSGRRFLKMTMSLEAETPELANEINTKMPQFRDTILLLLSSLSYDDIATLDGKMRLRNQMLNRINIQLTSGKIRNIYFSEFVVQ